MDTRLFALVYQEAQNYSSWQKKQKRLLQSGEEKMERENVEDLKKAKEFYSSLMRGVA